MRRAFLFLLAGLLGAQQAQDPARVRQQLAVLKGRMVQVDQQLEALKKRRKGVLVDLQGIALQRDRVQAQLDSVNLRQAQTQARIASLTQEQARIQAEMQRLRTSLRQQVRWMQAMGPFGELGLYTSFRDPGTWLAKGRILAWARLQVAKKLAEIQQLEGDLAAKGKALQEAQVRQAAEARQAKDLQAALQLQEERLKSFLEGIQKDEAAQKQVQGELAEEALQLQRLLDSLTRRPKDEFFVPAEPFADLRGKLPQPVPGTLVQGFGEHLQPQFHTRTLQTGVLVAAAMGTPVRAVADGRVVFADFYQSYGPMVILDHGGGWFTLYTHLQGLSVAKGQILKQGEALGAVGDTVDGPRLGFEIRHMAKAEDPQRWLRPRYR